MTSLERAIAEPAAVPGFGDRSPVDGLDRRSLGFLDVLAQSVAAVAPSAAATTIPLLVAAAAGGAMIWSVGAATLLALLVAASVNEFARRMAATGSLYTFVVRGLGRAPGVAAGVALLLGYGFISMFALAGAGYYLAILITRALPDAVISPLLIAVMVGLMAAFVLVVLVRGVRLSTRASLFIEAASVAVILVLVVTLLVQTGPHLQWNVLDPGAASPASLIAGAVLALTAFVGFESSATLSVEARRRFSRVPRAIVWTVLAAGLLYVVAAYSQAVGFERLGLSLGASPSPVNDLTDGFGIQGVGPLLDVSIAASFLACAIASTTALTRVLFSLGREGVLPSSLGRTHPQFRSPHIAALWAVPMVAAVPIASVLVGVSLWGLMQVLIVVAAAGYITAYVLTCIAAPVFLHRIGELTAWGGARSALTALVLTGAVVVYLAQEVATERWIGVAVFGLAMGIGLGLYAVALRRRPWITSTMGMYDEPVVTDVLGGASDSARDR